MRILLEITDFEAPQCCYFASVGGIFSGQYVEEGGFACAVTSDKGDLFILVNDQGYITEDREAAIRFAYIFCLQQGYHGMVVYEGVKVVNLRGLPGEVGELGMVSLAENIL